MKKTICDHFAQISHRNPLAAALLTKKNNEWVKCTWQDYYNKVELLGLGLLELGVHPKDRIALVSSTRMEWAFCDFAILGIQAVTIPIYQNSTPEDLEYILNDSQSKVLILENRSLLKTFLAMKERCPTVEEVICFEPTRENEAHVRSFEVLMQLGSKRKELGTADFIQLCSKTKSKDIATILYTSGTTGQPKGVVLCHEQIISEISEAFPYVGASEKDCSLSFLPYAHILGRIDLWGSLYWGYTLAFAESIEKIKNNLVEVNPTFFFTVPRIFEKMHTAIHTQMSLNPMIQTLFRWAIRIGKQVGDLRIQREPIPMTLWAQYEVANRLILQKIKALFGNRFRFAVSGGAPLNKEMALFFHACDVLILEGYGLTETTAAIAVNAPHSYKFGTVGKPFGDVKVKIASDGEILVQSQKVMREYWNQKEWTDEVLKDSWFHTGDIGVILPSGEIQITDRKKDLIKTAGGKYVAPQKLENLLKIHPMISHALIHGDQKKYIVALITLDKPILLQWAKDQNISYSDYSQLTQNYQLVDHIRHLISETNSHLSSFETIKRFSILPNDFTIESGELTPSLKIKRKILDQKYIKQIETLYK